MKRKGESYLGGHTVITLHPKTVEAGLREQAAEHQRQQRNDQQSFDEQRAKQIADAELRDFQSHSPKRRALQNTEKFYRDQLHKIERLLHTNPHPRIKLKLLSQELVLLEKLLAVVTFSGIKRKIKQRMYHARHALERMGASNY
jgi:hypothetical protein